MLFEPATIASRLERLAREARLYVGTTSWKFPGWCGVLYDEDHYLWGTHFSKARFKRDCLTEYARVFKTVCVDATYYRIPKNEALEALAAQVPDDFRFTFKVPDDITIKTYPDHPTFGRRRGTLNTYFLSHGFFTMGFLRKLERIRGKVGMLVFEFSHFHATDFEHGRDFVAALDQFFGSIPDDWQYGVEVRNANLLHPEYFEMLRRHGVSHIYNQWTHMPPVTEQLARLPHAANPFTAARFLLTPGRAFEFADRTFAPFNQIHEIDPGAREALKALVHDLESQPSAQPSYLYVGNHLEGNALHTIADILSPP